MASVFFIDEELSNADWLRSKTWDIFPIGLDALLITLGVRQAKKAEQVKALKGFMRLPAAKAMPKAVRSQIKKKFPEIKV